MLKTVYAVLQNYGNEHWDEIGRFYKEEKAIAFAKKHRPARIDIDIWEITKNGRECIDSTADYLNFPKEN